MTRRRPDATTVLLSLMTAGLPSRRRDWGAAMRAELAALDPHDVLARRRFARSASAAAFWHGIGLQIVGALAVALLVAGTAVTASRLHLPSGGPGILEVTVPVPAAMLLILSMVLTAVTRSFRFGVQTGLLAVIACFGAVFVVAASEGLLWMQSRGVFVLDGDPPSHPVSASDVVVDLFSTGLWLGHLLFWLPWPVLGAALGAAIGSRLSRPAAA